MNKTICSLALALTLSLSAASPALACGPLTPEDEVSFAVQEHIAMTYLPRGRVEVLAIDEAAGTACARVVETIESDAIDLRYTVELARVDGAWRVTQLGAVEQVPHSRT